MLRDRRQGGVNYCPECGAAAVSLRVPPGDTRARQLCERCGHIAYVNPKMVAGAIPVWEEKVLLCRRAIEPRAGLWTLPAGFLELGETMAEGARREALEEANADVEIGDLYALYSVPHISQVYALFRARLLDASVAPGEESLEVALFSEEAIPWAEIAFPAIGKTLELYFEDRGRGRYRTHAGDILRASQEDPTAIFRIRSI